MDATTTAVLVGSAAASFAVGFLLGHLRARSRTSIEKAAAEALRLGDHPPAYKHEPPEPPQ